MLYVGAVLNHWIRLMDFAALKRFEDALAAYETERDVGHALHRLAEETVGVKLFTMTADNPDAGYVRRVYSSDEAAYPILGTKPIVFDANYEAMTRDRKTYVANSLKEMEGDFPDLDLIKSLGCGSAINMPVVAGGKMLGSVNLLDAEHYYGPERVALVEQLVVPAMACFLILRSAFTI